MITLVYCAVLPLPNYISTSAYCKSAPKTVVEGVRIEQDSGTRSCPRDSPHYRLCERRWSLKHRNSTFKNWYPSHAAFHFLSLNLPCTLTLRYSFHDQYLRPHHISFWPSLPLENVYKSLMYIDTDSELYLPALKAPQKPSKTYSTSHYSSDTIIALVSYLTVLFTLPINSYSRLTKSLASPSRYSSHWIGIRACDHQLLISHPVERIARCSMSLLIAIAWIMAITEVVINAVADIWFRIWTLGCHGSTSNWSHNPRNVQLPCGSQQNRHEHGWRKSISFPPTLASTDHNLQVFSQIMGFSTCFSMHMVEFFLGIGTAGSYAILQAGGEPCILYG
ncbi:hypothetical protein C8R48DRAFT_466072 [Suillus tomentosus]|nr:hypothetical protein C8R48DRAFT_466072 [Suillus tomentosus]